MSRHVSLVARALALVVACLVLAGCPKSTRRTLVPQVPTTGDAAARQRFLAAREEFLRSGGQTDEFRAIADEFAGDPVEPFALLFAGVAAQQAGEAAGAVASLEKLLAKPDLEAGLRRRGELYLGLATSYLGDGDRAVPLLAGSEGAIENDAERGEWLAAQVHAHLASARPLTALPWMDKFWSKASAAERGYVLARGAEVVAAAPGADVAAAWAAAGEGRVAVVLLAERVAVDLAATGDSAGATSARKHGADARRALDLPDLGPPVTADAAPVAPGRLGAIVAQSGKQARIGEQIARGLHVGAISLGALAPAITIVDAEGGQAATAVATLANGEALAIIGPADGASVDAASAAASDAGVPLLSLSPRPEERSGGGRWVFHVMHSAEARARSLARRAHADGVRTFAVLRPESGYGAAVARAFAEQVAAQGDALVVEVSYKADTRSFAGIVKKLGGGWQAVFVPDTADRVELVAPALAAAGMLARPAGAKKVKGGRPIVLLSTVEGAGDDYLREAGRYSEGALLAPGYFPGAIDERGLEFERQYQLAIGKPPTAVDAYAYDAVRALAALGAGSRDELARRLASARVDGVTGAIGFDAEHRRSDDGVVYVVEVDGGGVVVRAIR
ncbi:MAG: penicillin-binding protein activator [Myxococcales bacterium]|nr:penicillin-binding protein activator [Myxococcales bacterium]